MRWWLFPSIVLSLQSLAHGATQGNPEQRVLPCQPSQVSDLFPKPAEPHPELRVLITSFYGADEASEEYGRHVGSRMREEVESHARQEIRPERSGLHYSAIRVKFVTCSVDDHEKARMLGQNAQADVVLWGKAFCSGKNPRACQMVLINSGNTIKDSPGATMKNQSGPVVVQPPDPSAPGRFTTSLTVVRWLGLEANAQSHGQLRRIDQVAALGLPQLVSDKPRVLIDVVIGLFAARAHRYGLAAELMERAKQDVAAGVDGAAELYQLIGTAYLIAGRKEQGLANMEAALRACRSNDDLCQSIGLVSLGWAADRLGDKQQALQYYQRSLPLIQKVGGVLGEATALNNIGIVYSDLGDKQKALQHYQRSLPLVQKVGDVSSEAGTLNNIGKVYSDLGDKQQALQYYQRSLPLRQKAGDVSGEAITLNNIGKVYSDLGDKQQALQYSQRSLPLMQKVGDISGEAANLNNIGTIYSDLGDKQQALQYLERSLSLKQKVGDISGEARTLSNIGKVYSDLGDKQQALQYFQRSVPLFQKVGDISGEAVHFNVIGKIYSGLGDKQQALQYFQRSLPLFQKGGDSSGEASTLSNIGKVYSDLGDKQQALQYFQRSLPLFQKGGDIFGEAVYLNNIGKIHSGLGDKQQALQYYQRSLPLMQKVSDVLGEATFLINIGEACLDLGDKQQALQYFQRSLPLVQKVGDISVEATTLNDIGQVYFDLGDKQKALQYHQRSLLLMQKMGSVSGEAITRDSIAFVLRELGQISAAVTSFRAAATCHLRRLPSDTQEAVRSLSMALALALRARLRDEALDLARQLDVLDPDEARKLVRQSRVSGQTQSADAVVRYQQLSSLAEKLPPEPASRVRLLAQAGLTRAQARPLFSDCPGLVIIQVAPASQAERLDLRPGDILTSYQDTCLYEPQDLIGATKKYSPDHTIKVERFRDGSYQTITVQAGKLGVAAATF